MTTKATTPKATTPKKVAKAHPGDPVAYTAPHPVYTGGVFYEPGKPFVTAEPKGDAWEHVDPTTKAAIEAADPQKHDDPNLEDLDMSALRALAASLGETVPDDADEEGARTIIRAHRDATR